MANASNGIRRALRAGIAPGIALLLAAQAAAEEPLDLSNAEPRWVAVAFEISPPDQPARRLARFTRRLPAWLGPGDRPGQLRIEVDGALVERFLMQGHDPAPGSFGPFTWTFDARTGHVEAAELTGAVRKQLRLGFAAWSAEAAIRVHMDTSAPIAFETTELMGETIHPLCDRASRSGCTVAEPIALDPRSGYVNAVGSVRAESGPLRAESFSPLGEAIFSELDPERVALLAHGLGLVAPADVAAPPPSLAPRAIAEGERGAAQAKDVR